MKNIRVIAQLNIKGPNVVKPVHTEALRIVGDPKALALKYYQQGADELVYLDIVASLYQRSFDFELLKSVAKDIFIPITVGGGIRSVHDINNALRVGADKVAINTFAIHHPEFITEAAHEFGSQCIVLYIEAKKTAPEKWEVYTDGGREPSQVNAVEWARQAIDRGVGEILLTSIDQDGTRRGYDAELVSAITTFATVPVIVHGGAGSLGSVKKIILESKADAISAASIFHYDELSIPELKKYLSSQGINVRL